MKKEKKFIPTKRILLILALIIGVVIVCISINALVNYAGAKIASGGAADTSPEFAIANAFGLVWYPETKYEYVLEDDVLFAITLEPNGTNRTLNYIRDEGNNTFRALKNILVMGRSLYGLGFDSTDAVAALYHDQGKYILHIPVEGYSMVVNPVPGSEIIDIDLVSVYDNYGNELEYLEGENFRYYYYVSEQLPEDYKVHMLYKGEEYLLLDSNDLLPEEVRRHSK